MTAEMNANTLIPEMTSTGDEKKESLKNLSPRFNAKKFGVKIVNLNPRRRGKL